MKSNKIPEFPFFHVFLILSISYIVIYGIYKLVAIPEKALIPRTNSAKKEGFSEPPWAIIQYDNRPLSSEFQKLQERTKEYCSRHGYTYIFSDTPYELPPYWVKVKMANETMDTKKYKGVFWLDTDATVHSLDQPLDSLLVGGKSFYYSPDNPNWSSSFCAGVWFVRATPDGKKILGDWMNEYRSNDWRKEADGKWVSHGTWAGDTYEQGAFSNKVLPKYHDKAEKFNWTKLQGDKVEEDSFTLHFAGGNKEEKINSYFSSLK